MFVYVRVAYPLMTSTDSRKVESFTLGVETYRFFFFYKPPMVLPWSSGYDAFKEWWMNRSDIMEVFQTYDVDGSNTIDKASELRDPYTHAYIHMCPHARASACTHLASIINYTVNIPTQPNPTQPNLRVS